MASPHIKKCAAQIGRHNYGLLNHPTNAAPHTYALHCRTALKPGNIATVVYYCDYAQEYHQITGAVRKIDAYWKLLQIGNMSIDFCEIAEIEKVATPV